MNSVNFQHTNNTPKSLDFLYTNNKVSAKKKNLAYNFMNLYNIYYIFINIINSSSYIKLLNKFNKGGERPVF